MNKKLMLVGLSALALIAALAVAPIFADNHEEEGMPMPLQMRANGGINRGGRTSMINFTVREWTSSEDRGTMIAAVKDGKSVRDVLQGSGANMGRIAPAGGMGVNIRYAYHFDKDGGSTIILATDRPISVGEASQQANLSLDYNVSLAVIELDDSGDGAGSLWLGADIQMGADGRFEVTGAGQAPVHLGRVRVLN